MALRRKFVVIALIAMVLSTGIGRTAFAENDYSFGIAVLACDSDPGNFTGRDQAMPSDCRWVPEANLQLEEIDGTIIGACTTAASGWCHILTSMNSNVVLRVDETSLPVGYVPIANPVLMQIASANGGWITTIRADAMPALPEDGASLTIHSRVCPRGYDGDDYYGVCHSTPPTYSQTIMVTGSVKSAANVRSAGIDETGNATFEGFPPGDVAVQLGLPDGVDHLWSYCSRNGNPDDRVPSDSYPWFETKPDYGFVTKLTLDPDATIICDIYAVPAAE